MNFNKKAMTVLLLEDNQSECKEFERIAKNYNLSRAFPRGLPRRNIFAELCSA